MTNKKTVAQILEKKYKEPIIRNPADYPPVECISTGSLRLDLAIGGHKKMMGIPRGHETVIWGPKKAGKSTLCSHIIAETQKTGGVAAMLDVESAFEPQYAEDCGVNLKDLLYIDCISRITRQTFPLEDLWDIVDQLVRSEGVNLIIVDSIDFMSPRAEMEGELGESFMGKRGFINAQAMRRLVGTLRSYEVALIMIAQIRHKLGVTYGSTDTMSGGEAVKHAASLKIDMVPGPQIKENGNVVGQLSRIRIPWNRIAPPLAKVELKLLFGLGFCAEYEAIEWGMNLDIIKKRGSYLDLAEGVAIQGKRASVQYLIDNPNLLNEIEDQIKENVVDKYTSYLDRNPKTSENQEPEVGSDTEGV